MRRALFPVLLLLVAGCSQPFDPVRWREADLTTRARANMLPSLLGREHLIGRSRAEVVALLGPPTTTDKWREADLVYVLGPDPGLFPIDNEWLLIKLDRQQRVASYKRTVD